MQYGRGQFLLRREQFVRLGAQSFVYYIPEQIAHMRERQAIERFYRTIDRGREREAQFLAVRLDVRRAPALGVVVRPHGQNGVVPFRGVILRDVVQRVRQVHELADVVAQPTHVVHVGRVVRQAHFRTLV